MKTIGDPEDVAALLKAYRDAHGWKQVDLVRLSGVDAKLYSKYEKGEVNPTRQTLARLAKAGGLTVERFEAVLPVARSLRLALKEDVELRGDLLGSLSQEVTRTILSALAPALLELLTPVSSGPEVSSSAAFPALCRLLCERSAVAAADDPRLAVRLASLALRTAELAPEPAGRKLAMQGYCWAFVGNARRVDGKLLAAEDAFGRSDRLWSQGDPSALWPLSGVRLLDLKASLRIYQGRFDEAQDLLGRALKAVASSGLETGKLLLKQARALELLGEHERALDRLGEAERSIGAETDRRLLFGIRFNRIGNLLHLRLFKMAEGLLPEVQERAMALGNALDLVRVRWLAGRVAARLGRREEAVAAFEEVKEEFTRREIAYDAAVVSLDLAVLWLEEGRTAEVKELARQMLWIFTSQKVHKEALVALALFRKAAEREAATLALAQKVLGYLEKAAGAPGLPFRG